MNTSLPLLILFSIAAPSYLSAQTTVIEVEQTAMDTGEKALTWVAPDDSPDHGRPLVHFKTKNNKFHVGVGGSVKVTGSFDWGDPIDSDNCFTTSMISMNPGDGNGAKWQFGARDSYVYVNAVALPGEENQVGAYINFNFQGDNYAPKLQYAYIKWRGLSAGYLYSLFADQTAALPTIDYQGPNSYTGIQTPSVNYEHRFGKDGAFGVGIGLSQSMASITDGNNARKVNQRLPDIPAYVQYNYGGGSHVRFSAIMRNLYYRNLITERNNDKVGWGIKLSGITTVTGPLTAVYQVLYGKGISSYIQDLTDCGLDMSYSRVSGRMNPVKAWGGYAGLQYDLSDRLHLSGGYSHVRLYVNDGEVLPETDATYRYAQYAVGTLTYDITGYLSCGVEYLYGRRVQMDGAQRHDNRINTCLQVTF